MPHCCSRQVDFSLVALTLGRFAAVTNDMLNPHTNARQAVRVPNPQLCINRGMTRESCGVS